MDARNILIKKLTNVKERLEKEINKLQKFQKSSKIKEKTRAKVELKIEELKETREEMSELLEKLRYLERRDEGQI